MSLGVVSAGGHVSIMQEGQVVLKVLTVENPQRASDLACLIAKLGWLPSAEKVEQLARECGFGGPNSLLILGRRVEGGSEKVTLVLCRCYEDDELPDRYFSLAAFNDPMNDPIHRKEAVRAS